MAISININFVNYSIIKKSYQNHSVDKFLTYNSQNVVTTVVCMRCARASNMRENAQLFEDNGHMRLIFILETRHPCRYCSSFALSVALCGIRLILNWRCCEEKRCLKVITTF